jgi:hypothetical protein
VTQALKPCFCKKKPRAFYYAESKHKKNRETTGRTVAALFLLKCGAPRKPNSAEAASTGREKIASQSRRTQAERSQKKYSRMVFGSFWRQKERHERKKILKCS